MNMKNLLMTLFCLGLATPLFADGTNQLTDEKARASYAYGLLNGKQWKAQDVGFDPDIYIRGIKDGLGEGPTQMTEAEARETMAAFQKEFRAKAMARMKAIAETNKAVGEAFLATNKLNAGVKVLTVAGPNGQTNELQYQVLTAGTGPIPKSGEQATVNYRGTLLDGTEFDSSAKHGDKPFNCTVDRGIIRGWSEALKAMPVGSKWKLFIPADLGYGERGTQGIAPNSLLVFEIELLSVQPAPTPAKGPTPNMPLTSDIIKVPSAEEMNKGAKIETIKAEDVQKAQNQQAPK